MSMKHYLSQRYSDLKETISRDRSDTKTRIDSDLPLGIRFSSRMRLSDAPFLIAGDSGGIKYPGDEVLINAFSKVTLQGLKTIRLYVESRDDPDESAMVMLLLNESGSEVDEMYFFHELYEIPLYYATMSDLPDNEDETTVVDFWIGKNEGILGTPLFHTPSELTYERLWEHDTDRWLQPPKVHETINLDVYGENTIEVEHLGTMLFSRSYEGLGTSVDEYLLGTVERDETNFRVRIWVGIPMSLADIQLPDAV